MEQQDDTQAAANCSQSEDQATVNFQEQSRRTKHIHAILYVEKNRHMVRLGDLQHTQYRRTKWRNTPTSDALWAGICALDDKCNTMLTAAREDGLLLMCWEGSRVDEITDAEEVAA